MTKPCSAHGRVPIEDPQAMGRSPWNLKGREAELFTCVSRTGIHLGGKSSADARRTAGAGA